MDVQVSMPPPPPPPPPPPAFFAETTTSQLTSPPPPQPVTTTTTNVTTTSTQDRIWLHPWTVTEMRENASQWSLAGDAGVLLYMEQFSDKLTQRADAIQQHLNQTVNAVKSTHTRVLNCLNEFTSLANTQFIENRVYDEDETVDNASKKDEQSADKTNVTEAQEKVLQRYVEAIQYGLAILDTHFERVEAKLDNNQNGDPSYGDDDEDGGVPLEPILEPKDPYIFRPLPHLIGTTEFMQDDYVGLGDLLTLRDEDGYEFQQVINDETDSAVSSEAEDEEEQEEKDNEFQVQMSPAPLVHAGASKPDFKNPPPPTTTVLTDSEGDDEDPFGINKNTITRIDDNSSKPAVTDYDLFSEETKPPPPLKTNNFALDSENEDNDDFLNNSNQKSQPIIRNNDANLDDTSSKSSNESDEPEETKPKGVSMFGSGQTGMAEQLAAAVLRRRKVLGDPDPTSDNDNDDDDFVKKPTKKSNKTSKPKSEPSSSTISNLTSQPLTTPTKISNKPSIFGENDDDDDDPFGDSIRPTTAIPSSTTKVDTKIPPKKEKDLFDVSDDDDPFTVKKPAPASTKKTEPISKPQTTVINKPKPIIYSDHSGDDDEFFGTKKTQIKPTTISSTPTVTQSNKSLDSDDGELFTTPQPNTKTQPSASTTTKKLSDDEDSLFSQPSVPQVVPSPAPAPAPVVVSSVKKPVSPADEDSDEDMFTSSKKTPQTSTTGPSKVVPSTKDDDEDEEEKLFNKPTTKSTVLPKPISKVNPPVISDEENDLFPPKTHEIKLPPVTLTHLPASPSAKPDTYVDPLRIQKPDIPTKTSSVPTESKLSDDDSEKDSAPTPPKNEAAVKDGEKPKVKDLAALLKIPQGPHKPVSRPKTRSITEEPSSPPIDDTQPIQKIEPPPAAIVKKTTKLALDSDDDDEDLFKINKKKETPISPIVEKKDKTNIENENENETGKMNVKALSARIKLPLMMGMPGSRPKPIANEDNESNNTTQKTSNEEPTIDKTMLDMSKDRTKLIAKNRTPRSRPTRSARAAAASTNENDDLFASSNSTTTPPSSPPVVVPKPPPPSVAVSVNPPPSVAVPVNPPPSIAVPVTGLPDKSAAIAAKQTNSKEKKKFSLFDSDDSDIDELLFGFSKKTKSSVVTKPTTTPSTKVTTKSSALSLDDDTDDFLSKRPTTKKPIKPVDIDDNDDFVSKRPIKKTTKPVDNDDIFADVKGKGPQANKAKKDWSIMDKSTTNETDDIFNETSTKSSSTTPKPKPTKNFDDPLNILSKR